MEAKDLAEAWDGLSLVEDWLKGGLRREGPRPDFEAIAARCATPTGQPPVLVLVATDTPLASGDEALDLLDKMLKAIDLSRDSSAALVGLEGLEAQVQAQRPRAILCLGESAAQALLGVGDSLGELRASWRAFHDIPFLATYHPRDLLADGAKKRPAWEDLKLLKEKLGDANLR